MAERALMILWDRHHPMTAAHPNQSQVDEVARTLAPDVIRIRMQLRLDESGDPAIYFRVILSDEAAKRDLWEVTQRVRARLSGELGLEHSDRFPYFRFRTMSEQAVLRNPIWD